MFVFVFCVNVANIKATIHLSVYCRINIFHHFHKFQYTNSSCWGHPKMTRASNVGRLAKTNGKLFAFICTAGSCSAINDAIFLRVEWEIHCKHLMIARISYWKRKPALKRVSDVDGKSIVVYGIFSLVFRLGRIGVCLLLVLIPI